jgi:multiple sugar transport system ATP-binding protein
MATVSIRHLGVKKPASAKHSGALVSILEDISLEIKESELLVLIGPSGCGKSTLLRCIAGLEQPSSGEIVIDGQSVNDLLPCDRDIAMVFQSYALYPHMTVFDNLAFGLRMRRTPTDELNRRVNEAARMLEISHLMQRYPRELSGGQRQRVAMGRAVVRRPRAFLFDEPLSNLDATLRQQMRLELRRLHQELCTTTIYVTHDQIEAMTLADRIAVIKQGTLVQIGTPNELYDRPANTFVARFFGTPEMNLIEGRVEDGVFLAEDGATMLQTAVSGFPSGPAIFGVRAEHLSMETGGRLDNDGKDVIRGTVEVVENLGSEALAHVRVGKHRLIARCLVQSAPNTGQDVRLKVSPQRWHLFAQPASTSPQAGKNRQAGIGNDGVRLTMRA